MPRGRVQTPYGTQLDLPPPFRLISLREVGDAFAHAIDVAPDEGAGTLVFVGRFDLAEFAVVLEPDEPLRTARRAFYAGMAALGDALAAQAPPEKPMGFDWPDAIRIDGGLVGGARLAWPQDADEDAPPSWLVFGGGFDQSFVRTFMKRSFDIVCSLIIMVLTLPLMLLAALAVKLEDRGPVFYSQERVGKDGERFFVHKFRSMRTDAEKGGKPQWAQQNDPRITRVGNFMRKTRIDELPQVLNVLKGDMSFVGPRPERQYFVDQLIEVVPYYNVRHSVKPGITGWAQVRYGYGSSAEDALQKLQYDLYYVKNNSLFLDVLILIDTLKVVLFRSGR